MAGIVNDRDIILQYAAVRTLTVADPAAVIIPGYTGIVLVQDISIFVGQNSGPYTVSPARMVLTAQLKGIPQNNPVSWHMGKIYDGPTIFGFNEEPTSVILTDTGDQLVKTVEANNYPIGDGRYPVGLVRVQTTYGGQVFTSQLLWVTTKFG